MKFSIDYETRWHDTDASRFVRPSALLVYMQETSNRHVASIGMPLDELRDKKDLAFILSKIRIAIYFIKPDLCNNMYSLYFIGTIFHIRMFLSCY